MAKVRDRTTYAVHEDCGDVQHGTAAWTYREWLAYLGTEHLRALGWKVPLPPMPQANAA